MIANPLILVSDDEPQIISMLCRLGSLLGVTVVGDTRPERILELARTLRPAVVVLDVDQAIDGRDLLSRLKKDPATHDLPVIMLSGHEDQFLRINCLELGAFDYATKPVDIAFMSKLARMARDGFPATQGWA